MSHLRITHGNYFALAEQNYLDILHVHWQALVCVILSL